MEAFESGVALQGSFFASVNDDTDLVNLFPGKWLKSIDLEILEASLESVDPSEAVLILDLCRGDDDPGSESLNLDPL